MRLGNQAVPAPGGICGGVRSASSPSRTVAQNGRREQAGAHEHGGKCRSQPSCERHHGPGPGLGAQQGERQADPGEDGAGEGQEDRNGVLPAEESAACHEP